VLGRLIAGDRSAYTYLPDSVRAFPGAEAIAQTMGEAGLADVRWRYLGLGTVTLHLGKRAR
jgi:demethylmenaquinone methyltransferase/2-methoxy-6-polyprenyl-1,4-benzoquinol methylase